MIHSISAIFLTTTWETPIIWIKVFIVMSWDYTVLICTVFVYWLYLNKAGTAGCAFEKKILLACNSSHINKIVKAGPSAKVLKLQQRKK